jgi:hypothetical protein
LTTQFNDVRHTKEHQMPITGFHQLQEQTLTACWSTVDEVYFKISEQEVYRLYHDQDCCELVYVESIDGELEDLVGTPLQLVEETSNYGNTDWGSETWTFYKLATVKGYVTIRFYGSSNGYYSESVYFGSA